MKKRLLRLLLIVVLTALVFFAGEAGWAAETEASQQAQDTIGFTVKTVLPNSQIDSSKSFYFLKVAPGEKQTIQLRIISTRSEARTVRIHVNDAVTSSEGSVEYGIDEPELDESLHEPVSAIVSIPEDYQEITVADFEEKTVELTIEPPAVAFAGIKLGAIRILGVPEDSEQKAQGLTVQTGYTVGLVLTEDAQQYNTGGDLKLKDTAVVLSNGSKVVGVTLQNDQPKIIEGLELKAEVVKKDSRAVLYQIEGKDLAVAPNSRFTYEIPLGLDDVMAGSYTLRLRVKNAENDWSWEEDFVVTGKQAAALNEETVDKVVTPAWVSPAAIGLTGSLLGLGGYLPYRQQKVKQAQKVKPRKRRKQARDGGRG